MSVKLALISQIGCAATMGFGKPTALSVHPLDLADLESEIVDDINRANDGSTPLIVGHVSDGTLSSVPDGAAMVFLGVAIYPSSDTPRGEFRVR